MSEQTKVIFRIYDLRRVGGNGQEVIAIFPELPGDCNPLRTCLSYAHIGQHGAITLDFTQWTRRASPGDPRVKALRNELELIGYNLRVGLKRTRADDKRRHEAAKN